MNRYAGLIGNNGHLRELALLFDNANLWFLPNQKEEYERRVSKRFLKFFPGEANKSFPARVNKVYSVLDKHYQSEYILKNELLNGELLKHFDRPAAMFQELKIHNSIADVFFINGEAKAFEIKSKLDRTTRLDSQIRDYQKVAEKVYVVASSNLIDEIIAEYSDSPIGVFEYQGNHTLKKIRDAKKCVAHFDHVTLFKMLRQSEYLDIIEETFGERLALPNMVIFKESLKRVLQIDVESFQKQVMRKLKMRKLVSKHQNLLKKIPHSLRFAASQLEKEKLLTHLVA